MDIGLNTLLVALMFVTILSMGIGNILMTLADVFNHAKSSRWERAHVGWIFLLLLVHFNMFWQTKEILAVDDWQFEGFLLAMAGPVLMFFATSILLTNPNEIDEPAKGSFFMELGHRFFWMFAALQVWIVGVGVVLVGSFVVADVINISFAILAVVLALNSRPRIQVVGVWAAWCLGLVSLVLRWVTVAG